MESVARLVFGMFHLLFFFSRSGFVRPVANRAAFVIASSSGTGLDRDRRTSLAPTLSCPRCQHLSRLPSGGVNGGLEKHLPRE